MFKGLGFRLLLSVHGLNVGDAWAYNRSYYEIVADVEPHHAS
jgi:hypothetical protein